VSVSASSPQARGVATQRAAPCKQNNQLQVAFTSLYEYVPVHSLRCVGGARTLASILRVTTHAAGAVAAPEGGTRVRLTSLWSCVHVRVPWIRAGGTYGETLLQTLSVWHQILRLAWDRFTGLERSATPASVPGPVWPRTWWLASLKRAN
jgi:hypothetical protein